MVKCLKIFDIPFDILKSKALRYITPNIFECEVMAKNLSIDPSDYQEDLLKLPEMADDELLKIAKSALKLSQVIPHVIVKLGKRGVLYLCNEGDSLPRLQHFPIPNVINVVNVTGAGDSFAGAILSGLTLYGPGQMQKIIQVGQRAAALTLKTNESVSKEIVPALWGVIN